MCIRDSVTPDLPQTFKVRDQDRYILLTDSLTEFKLRANYPGHSATRDVQGHKVKYSNRNNSALDCSILLKFGTEFDRGTASIQRM